MYRLEHPTYLHVLWLIPAILAAFWLYRQWQKKAQKTWGQTRMLQAMVHNQSTAKLWIKAAYLCAAILFLAIGLANPQVGIKTETVKRMGIHLVFALDVSKSMLAEDVAPNRLEKAKHLISKTIDKLGGDRIGIIAYAGNAYPLLPITTDYAAAKMAVNSASPEFISAQGTALDQALDYSIGYFDNQSAAGRILVILSDGEDHEDNWEEQIEKLKAQNIQVVCIGLGTAKGGPIPVKKGKKLIGYKKDQNNEVVITKLNASVLSTLAKSTNGTYTSGSNINAAVKEITQATKGLEKTEFEEKIFTDYEDQFQWFIGAAILLLLLDLLTANRKNQWLKKWGLKTNNNA